MLTELSTHIATRETQISQQFAWYIKEKKYLNGLQLLDDRRLEQERLTFRSALFMVIWVPLSFFALTSTTGLFGKGVVMGLMLHILADAWRLQKSDPRRLHVRLFWLIKREVTDEERLVFLSVITAFFALFSFWVGVVSIYTKFPKSKTDDIFLLKNSSRPRPVGLRIFFLLGNPVGISD